MDKLTQDLINDRKEQKEKLEAWMKTKEAVFSPIEVKIAVIGYMEHCKGQIKMLGGEV